MSTNGGGLRFQLYGPEDICCLPRHNRLDSDPAAQCKHPVSIGRASRTGTGNNAALSEIREALGLIIDINRIRRAPASRVTSQLGIG